ncbi:hypothetical protein EDC04DRAFT_2602741 [Pisolithus marmoratus]|nr:hypothetical protein EDC04DRAFT_2602741 [Pisolithus marmoratus]
MAASDSRKWLSQSEYTLLAEAGIDSWQKPKRTDAVDAHACDTGTETLHHSSRLTKGSGSQMAQLQNIEHIQTEQSATSNGSHASQLKMATANELLNPMALMKPKPKPKPQVKTFSACVLDESQLVHIVHSFESSTGNQTSLFRAYMNLWVLTEHLHLHIKQLFKALSMAFILQTQKSNTDMEDLLLLCLVEGLLCLCLMEDLLALHPIEDPLSQYLMEVLPQVLMGDLPLQVLIVDLLQYLTGCPLAQSLDLNFNEVSPDEDDRVAENLICNDSHAECRSQLPRNSYNHGLSSSPIDAPLDEPLYTPPEIEGPIPRKTSAPSGKLTGPATKLCSYPFKFCEIIEWAKQLAQCGTALDPFPTRAWFVDEKSAMYITEAIAEQEQMGVLILPGKCGAIEKSKLLANNEQATGLIITKILAYWYDYFFFILWESLMTWQSTLKAKGWYYKEHGIASSGWPHHRIFLHRTICSWQSIPRGVCAGGPKACCVPCSHSRIQQDCQLESSTYSKVFMQLMAMQAKIDGNHKHAASLRIGWATTGR